jgi:hypothetical protein
MISRTFTIANLLWLIVAAAVVQGIILAPNVVTGTLFALGILGILTTSLLAIGYRRGRRRAAWVGFAAFAWPYGLLLLWMMMPPRFFPPDHVVVVLYWTLVPAFGLVGSIVARRLYDTREPAEAVGMPTAHPLDPEPRPHQPQDTLDHAR